MALEAEKQQLEKIRRTWSRWSSDPVQLRFIVALLLTAIGLLAVERPLSGALALARVRNADAETTAHLAEELCRLSEQVDTYTPRASVEPDLVAWQNYVLEKLSCTTTTLIALEPHKTIPKGPFEFVELEVVAKGHLYSEFVDFIDRLEHGERLLRIDKLRFERQQTSIYMTCIIRGLCKSGAPVKKSATTAKATDTPAPAAAPAPGATASDAAQPATAATEAAEASGATSPATPDDAAATDASSTDASSTGSATPPEASTPSDASAPSDSSSPTDDPGAPGDASGADGEAGAPAPGGGSDA